MPLRVIEVSDKYLISIFATEVNARGRDIPVVVADVVETFDAIDQLKTYVKYGGLVHG